LNQRPPGYEPDELPGCSTPRYLSHYNKIDFFVNPLPKASPEGFPRFWERPRFAVHIWGGNTPYMYCVSRPVELPLLSLDFGLAPRFNKKWEADGRGLKLVAAYIQQAASHLHLRSLPATRPIPESQPDSREGGEG
jgi:hypothetical protein